MSSSDGTISSPRSTRADATDRRIDATLSVRDGRLFADDIEATALAARFGTPIYVVSEARLRSNARRWTSALASAWPHGESRVLPSLKANFALAIRRILTQEGLGCDVFGPGEFRAAMASGVPPAMISLNGSVKSQGLIDDAVRAGAKITLDATRELDLILDAVQRIGLAATVRLRTRPDYRAIEVPSDFLEEEVATSEVAGRYKAGLPLEDLIAMGRRILERDDVTLSGLHVHFPRHRAELEVWQRAVSAFAGAVGEASSAWEGWRPRELDLGGGFATRRDPTGRLLPRQDGRPTAPEIEDYARVVAETLSGALVATGLDPEDIALEVEPGRSMFADTGLHLARVENVKREHTPVERIWVETDTTEMFLPDSLIEHNRWPVVVANRADEPQAITADIVGMSCGFDLIVPDEQLPDVAAGDVLAFLDTGAYQDATATNFNALPRPATVLVHDGGAEVVKRAETFADVFSRDVVPERLAGGTPP
jgi:diaminopimelate decarboxylase